MGDPAGLPDPGDSRRSRRLELAALVSTFPLTNIAGALGITAAVFLRGGTLARASLAAYLAWTLFDGSPARGGFRWAWRCGLTRRLRNSALWRAPARYFPVKLERTAELPAKEGPYIFVCHPHGIIGIAPMTHFGTNATGFEDVFPGIDVHLLGHSAIFRVPFFREWVLLHGHGTVDKTCCLRLLSQGHSIALAPGGAKESLDCTPGSMRLLLKSRKGFAKLALRAGATLVPVLSFGENEVYSTIRLAPGSFGRRVQDALQARLGWAVPLFFGRTLLPLLPRRQKVASIVGAPVRPPADRGSTEPTAEEVDAYHRRYCDALEALFLEHRASHGAEGMELELV